ncbi:AAA domain-containing protein [Nocardia sp. NPDC051750]|uniref:AAA domain-containing protein n=1 Tax=Nocardia sp. NPDC051750 TaxID=3364325 RepID=UPI0037A7BD02
MFVVGDRVVCGATDLERAARCEFALLRALDAELGTVAPAESGTPTDTSGFGHFAALVSNAAGHAEFDRLRTEIRLRHGAGVVELPPPGDHADPLGALAAAHTASVAAVRAGAPAVLGPVFFDGDFFTRVDLVTRTPLGLRLHGAAPGPAQRVATALRLSAGAQVLEALSIPVDLRLQIHAGTETHTVDLADAQPVYRAGRRRMQQILDEHSTELLPVQWGDPRFRACGRCTVCTAAAAEARDLLLVAGMDPATRSRLRAAGISTIDRLTTRTVTPPEIPGHVLTRLRAQAVVQLRQEHSGRGEWLPSDPAALDMLPPATPGDLALHTRQVAPDRLRVVVASREAIRLTCELPLEPPAGQRTPQHHTTLRDGARRAFTDLLAALTEPLLADPDLHIFHYTADARTLLLHTSGRLGTGEETVDALLRTGALVDLYPIVRGALVLGTRSYALHAVVPVLGGHTSESEGSAVLWLADRLRKEATESAPPYPRARTGALDRLLRETPSARSSPTEAALAEYAAGPVTRPHTAQPAPTPETTSGTGTAAQPAPHPGTTSGPESAARPASSLETTSGTETSESEQELRSAPPDPHRIAALTAALLGYHRREQQSAWWAHIDRLTHPLSEWSPDPGVMVADTCVVDTKWHIGPGDTMRRFLRLSGRLTGNGLAPGTAVSIIYEPVHRAPRPIRTTGPATVLGCSMDADLTDTVRLEETLAPGAVAHDELPVALAPALPGLPVTAAEALEDIGEQLLMTLPALPDTAVFDLLTRRPPRLRPALGSVTRGPVVAPPAGSGPTAGPITAPGQHIVPESDRPSPADSAACPRAATSAAESTAPVVPGHESAPEAPGRRPAAPISGHSARLASGDDHSTANTAPTTPTFESATPATSGPGFASDAPGAGVPRTAAPVSVHPGLPPADGGPAAAITATLRELDRSYLAVQAPTGTGRTAILADVLAELVIRDNWRIGIVAPTSVPVENLLDAIVRAGVLPELVAKSDAAAVAPEWLVLDSARYPRFLSNAIRGCVLGGTPDDFTDPARVPRDALDLLVIADANTVSLAMAAALSVSARNLLLTGDPAERYRPEAGPHPQPVDVPALTWLTGGRRTLPASHGYFLDRTHRIHPQVSDPVSHLYFDDRLRAAPVPPHADVTLEPGITTVLVEHHGNTTAAEAEAREVLQRIRDLLGRRWYDGSRIRQLQPHDIVVVSPHRAQVSLIRTHLSRARIDEVLVGTPELFRGREAAVVLVSPATSSPEDAPGPVGALLSDALVHDALCRARRHAIIVRSPLLTEFLPETLGELSALSRFIRL